MTVLFGESEWEVWVQVGFSPLTYPQTEGGQLSWLMLGCHLPVGQSLNQEDSRKEEELNIWWKVSLSHASMRQRILVPLVPGLTAPLGNEMIFDHLLAILATICRPSSESSLLLAVCLRRGQPGSPHSQTNPSRLFGDKAKAGLAAGGVCGGWGVASTHFGLVHLISLWPWHCPGWFEELSDSCLSWKGRDTPVLERRVGGSSQKAAAFSWSHVTAKNAHPKHGMVKDAAHHVSGET